MKKTVKGKIYDTAEMSVANKVAHGTYGDPAGYEEILYVSDDGLYFLYTNGGENSPYTSEKLTKLSKVKAEEWKKANA